MIEQMKEAAEGYEINDDKVIVSPGKFENEPWWAPYFWEKALDGFADDEEIVDETVISVFNLRDFREIPDFENAERLFIWSDDAGFIHTSLE